MIKRVLGVALCGGLLASGALQAHHSLAGVYDIRGARVAPVWEGPRACPAEPVALAIAPGESAVLPIPPTSAGEILSPAIPAAAYRVTLWLALAPDERVIEIEAGEVELTTSS